MSLKEKYSSFLKGKLPRGYARIIKNRTKTDLTESTIRQIITGNRFNFTIVKEAVELAKEYQAQLENLEQTLSPKRSTKKNQNGKH